MQRERNFFAYQDIEFSFEKRSLWMESIGDWGEGGVMLFEIPTKEEVHDNIAAFWRPKNPLQTKGEHNCTYRLHWGPDSPKPQILPLQLYKATLPPHCPIITPTSSMG